MRPLVIQNENGMIDYIMPTPEALAAGITVEDIAARLQPGQTILPVKITQCPLAHDWAMPAWEWNGADVTVNIPKAKEIAHTKRRARRAALFAPLDTEATIPAKAAQAEAARQAIRDADTGVQNSINAATTEAQLKQILIEYGAI